MANRLGRGLDSLLGILDRDEEVAEILSVKENHPEKPTDSKIKALSESVKKVNEKTQKSGEIVKNTGVIDIEISLIDNNTEQPRKKFDQNSLEELAQSIREYGVVQPIIVVSRGKRYSIVAGERRFRASKIAGLKTIPAVVRDYSEMQIKEIALLENIQREDLNPIETARALHELMQEFNWTQEIISQKFGKSRPAIANTLRLLSLTEPVIKMVEEGKLSAGHARSLVVVTDPEVQLRLANLAVTKRITVRDMEKAVKEVQAGKPVSAKRHARELPIELKNFEDKITKRVGTKAKIVGNNRRGKITISYYNADDLDRIYEIFNTLTV